MKKIIYDVGSNNGDDIPYYLLKGDIVVAIEANPVLCEAIKRRFQNEVESGRLIIECCIVTNGEGSGEADFYLHKSNHVLSQLPMPPKETIEEFTRVQLPARSIQEIIISHGSPYYIKIDVEHYDAPLLKAIFASGIRPPYISAESHTVEVFSTLATEGNYKAFKLVDGYSVSRAYAERLLECHTTQTRILYSFPFHSAGPFGNDIDGKWMTADNFFKLLALEGLGWKDIHASSIEQPDPTAEPRYIEYFDRLVSRDELLAYFDNQVSRAEQLSYICNRALRKCLEAFRKVVTLPTSVPSRR
jgi:FkbM family methyltransferase